MGERILGLILSLVQSGVAGLAIPYYIRILLIAGTWPVQLMAIIRGESTERNFRSWRFYLGNPWMRFALFGFTGLVLDFILLVLAILFTFGLQVGGILKRVPFSYNLRNLVIRWRTTLLTALAFTLVVALMTLMLAFVNGMYKLTESSGVPANVMVLSEGSTDELFSNLAFTDISALYSWQGVVKDIDGKPLVSKETYIVCNQPIPNAAKGGRQRRFLQIRGIEEPERSGRVHNLALHEGGPMVRRLRRGACGSAGVDSGIHPGGAGRRHRPRAWARTGQTKPGGRRCFCHARSELGGEGDFEIGRFNLRFGDLVPLSAGGSSLRQERLHDDCAACSRPGCRAELDQ